MVARTLLFLFLLVAPVSAARLQPEAAYQQAWCDEQGGQVEVIQSDGTRVDCLLPEYAIEFDFADKWAEAIGQALHYSHMTARDGGIVLIVEDQSALRHANKLLSTIYAHRLPLRVWIIGGE